MTSRLTVTPRRPAPTAQGPGVPAAGTFDGWPKTAKELKCLDPCMGSGHFVVAMFERLVALRMAEGELEEAEAVAAVISDNLFGLEIDPRLYADCRVQPRTGGMAASGL